MVRENKKSSESKKEKTKPHERALPSGEEKEPSANFNDDLLKKNG